MFLSLHSVIYNVDDLQKAKEWYGAVLNTEPAIDLPSLAIFEIGNNRLGLKLVDSPSGSNGSGPVVYWGVVDINAEYDRLIDLGAAELNGIRDMGGGVHRAELKDPFGNTLGIGGMAGAPDNKAIEEKPSKTALWTTHMRALSTREENEEIRGRDSLAEIFLPEEEFKAIRDMATIQEVREKYFVIGVYEYVMARTRSFDRFFKQALDGAFEQVVFLGAGYDSRPYRFHERLGETRIFELDIPPTQERKKRCLVKAGVDIPDQLTYVPINFNTESIKDVLFAAGFDKDKKTLFMWEGVTYYLAREAVDATLEFVRSNTPAGSAIAFDYVALWAGVFDAYGVKELIEFNAKKQSGESGGFFMLEEGGVESFLSERGFEMGVHHDSEDFEKSFLTREDGSLFGRVTGHFRVVQALTTG
ncbi:MAG: SAM-dependent methyltransferase [Desulfobacterales bacterium]|nr:SAM-dependent methyltransferase [Desulfobacterales bacterium]